MQRIRAMIRRGICVLAAVNLMLASARADDPTPPQAYLQFDGSNTNYVEVPDSTDFSVDTSGALTISAWMRPDALIFPNEESSGYVHWLGKGTLNQQEWTFRMYGLDNTESRENRISFYVFNNGPGRGCGSYFQDPILASQWIHVVGVVDNSAQTTSIYKNGLLRNTQSYSGIITPRHAAAPLRMGTRDFASFFAGALAQVRLWNRVLSAQEINDLYALGSVPPDGLVAEYLLNEGAGSIAFDTANGHDGTIFGSMWGLDSFPLDATTGRQGGGC